MILLSHVVLRGMLVGMRVNGWVDVAGAAERARVSEDTVRRWLREEEFERVLEPVRGRRFVTVAELLQVERRMRARRCNRGGRAAV
jgi:DeoR/GlpR family transcriptional regulator of sugar metabolism